MSHHLFYFFTPLFSNSSTFILYFKYFLGQQKEVSPKLDFDDAEDQNNNTVPIVTGVKQGRNDEREKESDGEKGGRSGPKIHGVRVTVDTGDSHKTKGKFKRFH